MQNVKIRFNADHVKQDSRAGTSRATSYVKDTEYSVNEGTARHYVKRGLAEYVMPKAKEAKAPVGNVKPVVIPDDWKQLPKKDLLNLASNFTPIQMKDEAGAIQAIDTELQRRAAVAPPPPSEDPPSQE